MIRGAAHAALLALLLVSFFSSAALATPCGDDLGGRRVACRCGDTVVADTTLQASDPIVGARCPLDGLTIRAAREAETLTLDLGGLTLRGSGAGVGLRIDFGGSDGARIVGAAPGGRAVIEDFGTGLGTTRASALANVARLELKRNRRDGARIAIAGTILEDVVAAENGADGINARGTGGRLIDVEARDNRENGIRLQTSDAIVEARALNNGSSGIVVDGTSNDVSAAQSRDNGKHGVVVRGRAIAPTELRTLGNESNGGDELRINGRRVAR